MIFLDPPFADDPWPWLLPACAARLRPGGFVYAEAARALAPPPGLATLAPRQGGAGALSSFRPRGLPRRPERVPRSAARRGRPAMLTVVYPGTFDPVHPRPRGPRAPRGAAVRPASSSAWPTARRSSPFFTTAERVAMAREVLAPYPNVEVVGVFRAADGFRPRAGRARDPARPARRVGLRVRVPDGGHEPQPLSGGRNAVPDARRSNTCSFRRPSCARSRTSAATSRRSCIRRSSRA